MQPYENRKKDDKSKYAFCPFEISLFHNTNRFPQL